MATVFPAPQKGERIMLTEKANDREEYDIKAPGGSLASFFNGTLDLGE